jgi:hypothetical protein
MTLAQGLRSRIEARLHHAHLVTQKTQKINNAHENRRSSQKESDAHPSLDALGVEGRPIVRFTGFEKRHDCISSLAGLLDAKTYADRAFPVPGP